MKTGTKQGPKISDRSKRDIKVFKMTTGTTQELQKGMMYPKKEKEKQLLKPFKAILKKLADELDEPSTSFCLSQEKLLLLDLRVMDLKIAVILLQDLYKLNV